MRRKHQAMKGVEKIIRKIERSQHVKEVVPMKRTIRVSPDWETLSIFPNTKVDTYGLSYLVIGTQSRHAQLVSVKPYGDKGDDARKYIENMGCYAVR